MVLADLGQMADFALDFAARLNLGPFNLIIGAHNSGKSTALKALQIAANSESFTTKDVATVGGKPKDKREIVIRGAGPFAGVSGRTQWDDTGAAEPKFEVTISRTGSFDPRSMFAALSSVPLYAFEPAAMARPAARSRTKRQHGVVRCEESRYT